MGIWDRKKRDWKANEDYKKRTEMPTDWNKKEASFFFATPCRWNKCKEWEDNKDADFVWKKVRGIWSRHLETWIERVPWVAAFFARSCLNRSTVGLRTIEMIWDDYANIPNTDGRQLPGEFVVNGRERIQRKFLSWLTAPSAQEEKRIIRFSGPSEREVLDFIAAGARSLAAQEFEKLCSRVFAVDDIASAQCLVGVTADHTILATGDVIPFVHRLWKKTNFKLVLYHSLNKQVPPPFPGIDSIELRPAEKVGLIQSVVELGYSAGDADELCQASSFDYERIRKAVFLY
jgi:hypothetical protein